MLDVEAFEVQLGPFGENLSIAKYSTGVKAIFPKG